METYGLLEPNPPPFQNTAMRRGTIRSGMRLSLLTETHIGTAVVKEARSSFSGLRVEGLKLRSRIEDKLRFLYTTSSFQYMLIFSSVSKQ